MSDKKKKEISEELEESMNELVRNNLASSDDVMPPAAVQEIERFNMADVSEKSLAKAQKTVLSCLKLYFDEKLINKNEYLQAKAAVATSNIQTLFNQLKRSEHMMDKLINEIDNGNMQPRMFEVATSVQNTIIELLKNTQLHIISMQEDFKRVKAELPLSELEKNKTIDITNQQNSDKNIYLNAKGMLKQLEEEENEDSEKDSQEEDKKEE